MCYRQEITNINIYQSLSNAINHSVWLNCKLIKWVNKNKLEKMHFHLRTTCVTVNISPKHASSNTSAATAIAVFTC